MVLLSRKLCNKGVNKTGNQKSVSGMSGKWGEGLGKVSLQEVFVQAADQMCCCKTCIIRWDVIKFTTDSVLLSLKEIFIFVVNFFKFLVAEGSLADPVHEQFVTYDKLYILSSFYFRQMLLNFCNYKVVLKIFIKHTSECFHFLNFFCVPWTSNTFWLLFQMLYY